MQDLELVPVLINLLKENAEGLDDLQFNLGKIQVTGGESSMFLSRKSAGRGGGGG